MLIKTSFIQQRALAMTISCLLLLLAALGITFLIYLFNFGNIKFMLKRTPIAKIATSSTNVPLAAIHDIVAVVDDDSTTTTDPNNFGDSNGDGGINVDVSDHRHIKTHDIFTKTVARAIDAVDDDNYVDRIYDDSDSVRVDHNNDDIHHKYHNAHNDNDDGMNGKMEINIISGISSNEHRVAYNKLIKLNQNGNDDHEDGDVNIIENKRHYYYVMPIRNNKQNTNNDFDVNGHGGSVNVGDGVIQWRTKPNRKTKKSNKHLSSNNNNNSNKLVTKQSPQQQSLNVHHDAIYIDDFEKPIHKQSPHKHHTHFVKSQQPHMQTQQQISMTTTYKSISNKENKIASIINDNNHHKNLNNYNNKTNRRHHLDDQQHQIDYLDITYDSIPVNYKSRTLFNDVHGHDDDDNNFNGSGDIQIYSYNNDRQTDNDDDDGDDDEGDSINDGYGVVKDGSGNNIIFNRYMQQFDAETSHFIRRINNRMSLYNNILGLKRNGSTKRFHQHNINSRNLQKQKKYRKSKSMINSEIEQQQPQKQQIFHSNNNKAMMHNTLLPKTKATTSSTIELRTKYNNNNISIKTILSKQNNGNIEGGDGVYDIGVPPLQEQHHETNFEHLHTKSSKTTLKTTPSTLLAQSSVISSSLSPSSSLTKSWLDTRTHRIIGNVKKSEERSRQLLLCEEAGGGELCRMLFKGHLNK